MYNTTAVMIFEEYAFLL